MSIHRATRAALAIALAASACLPAWIGRPRAPSRRPPSGATLALVSQTPYTTLKSPDLRITVAATNNSVDPMDGLR